MSKETRRDNMVDEVAAYMNSHDENAAIEEIKSCVRDIQTLMERIRDVMDMNKAVTVIGQIGFVGCVVSAGSADSVALMGSSNAVNYAAKELTQEVIKEILSPTSDENEKEAEKN